MKYYELILTDRGEDLFLTSSLDLPQLEILKKDFQSELKPGFKIRIVTIDTSKIKKKLSKKDIAAILVDIKQLQE
jgi:hypothetical protein